MFKACLILAAAFYSSSAQDVQNLLSQANAVVAPLANEVNAHNLDHAVSLAIGDYDWIFSENGEGEVELSVNSIRGGASNLADALAGLLTTAGASAQENVNSLSEAVNNKAQSVGVALQDNSLVAEAEQYGSQLMDKAESVAPVLAEAYNEVAGQLSTNKNEITDEVNQQVNKAVADPNNAAENLQNTANVVYQNLSASTANNLNDAASSYSTEASNIAANLASNVDPTQSAEALQNLSNQATNTVNNAAKSAAVSANSVPSSISNTVNSATAVANANNLGNLSSNIPNLRGGL